MRLAWVAFAAVVVVAAAVEDPYRLRAFRRAVSQATQAKAAAPVEPAAQAAAGEGAVLTGDHQMSPEEEYAAFVEMQAKAHAEANAATWAAHQAAWAQQAHWQAAAMQQYAGEMAAAAQAASQSDAPVDTPASLLETNAEWGYGRSFQPQLYGWWKQKEQGKWEFGGRLIECEACTYVVYMLISRLGDAFNRATIKQEAQSTCPRVQWVFQSACQYVLQGKNLDTVTALVLRLVEPHDICKHLNLCELSTADALGFGGMNGMSPSRLAATLPPSIRARMYDMRNKNGGSGSGSGSEASNGFTQPGLYGMQTLPFQGNMPLGLRPNHDLYGVDPTALFGGGKGSGSGSEAPAE